MYFPDAVSSTPHSFTSRMRPEAFQFAVDNGYDHPDYTDWVYSGVNTNKQGAVSATAATAGDNE